MYSLGVANTLFVANGKSLSVVGLAAEEVHVEPGLAGHNQLGHRLNLAKLAIIHLFLAIFLGNYLFAADPGQ